MQKKSIHKPSQFINRFSCTAHIDISILADNQCCNCFYKEGNLPYEESNLQNDEHNPKNEEGSLKYGNITYIIVVEANILFWYTFAY